MTKVKRMAKVYDITSEEIDDFPKHSPVSKREEYIIEALEYYGEVREGRNIKEKVVFVCEHIEKMSENQTINVANYNAMKYNKFVREAIKMLLQFIFGTLLITVGVVAILNERKIARWERRVYRAVREGVKKCF